MVVEEVEFEVLDDAEDDNDRLNELDTEEEDDTELLDAIFVLLMNEGDVDSTYDEEVGAEEVPVDVLRVLDIP
jgi:hypothetical protein